MKTFATAVGLAVGASAAVVPRNDGCCFQLSASGGTSGTLGQLDDGQNRVGGGLGEATYCINKGAITDGSGRGCILTAPTTQFQCDMGASPDTGFSVGGDGTLQHEGDSTFYACPADQGEYNIYTEKVDDQPNCVEVTLSTGGKCASGGASSTGPSQAQTCPPQQTVTKTKQGKASNVYKTETVQNTQVKPTTVYKTETVQNTQVKPTIVYKTETVQNTQVKPTTVYQTKTIEETETAKKPTTVYETKTVQQTVTAQTPTTVYQTKTLEETETAKKPTTVYETKTVQQTITAQTPTTVYQTKTVEETETAKAQPQTQYVTEQAKPSTVTKAITQMKTEYAPTETITKTEQNCPKEQPTKGQGKPTQASQASSCPTDLSGDYQYPHLILPVDSEHPDKSYGTSYNGEVSDSMSSVFNFDIPKEYEGQTCSLVFLFPEKSDLETSDYTFNGQGSISVDHLSSAGSERTTWNSVPESDGRVGNFSPQPGNSYVVSTGNCAAGTTQSYELSASGGLDLEYFQDYNPSPLGLYITTC